jgi:hypothetical protein
MADGHSFMVILLKTDTWLMRLVPHTLAKQRESLAVSTLIANQLAGFTKAISLVVLTENQVKKK